MARIKFYNKTTGKWEYADKAYDSSGSSGNVDLSGYAKTEDIPTKVSQLENDKGYLTQGEQREPQVF